MPLQMAKDRQPAIERVFNGSEFPFVARQIGLFQDRRVGHRLAQEFLGNVAAAGEEECVHLVERHRRAGGVLDLDLWMGRQDWIEPLFIAASNPAGKIRHRRTCDCWRVV
jgi:hypothetical protein